jgi:pimeloyl-ACP methyl ester carboxylesterase
LLALLTPALLGGCATPAERYFAIADESGLVRQVVGGTGMRHVLFWKSRGAPSPVLHVYIDGDGTPNIGSYAMADPTPRNPLMLRLLSLDRGPAVLVGRPCYHGLATDAGCRPALWLDERYSEAVVDSMAAVVQQLLAAGPYRRIAWFGYSGGGSLAMLLAARIPETAAVITLGANLDIDTWSTAHGARRLDGSLNPARQPALPASVFQRHYAGGRDKSVPLQATRNGLGPNVPITVIPDYDHSCCWADLWPGLLADLTKEGL